MVLVTAGNARSDRVVRAATGYAVYAAGSVGLRKWRN